MCVDPGFRNKGTKIDKLIVSQINQLQVYENRVIVIVNTFSKGGLFQMEADRNGIRNPDWPATLHAGFPFWKAVDHT